MPQWRFVAQTRLGPATRIVFDLDPGEGVTFRQLCEVAHEVRDLIADIGLTTFPLTSGSKGLHLYVPLGSRSVREARRCSPKGWPSSWSRRCPSRSPRP